MGIIQFGNAFKDYIALTDAVRVGARQAAVSRSIVDPSQQVPLVVSKTKGEQLNTSKMVITVKPWDPISKTEAWVPSGNVTVHASYPFKINLFGIVVFDSTIDRPRTRNTWSRGRNMPAATPRPSVFVPRARERAVRATRNHGAVRRLLVAAVVALALAVAAGGVAGRAGLRVGVPAEERLQEGDRAEARRRHDPLVGRPLADVVNLGVQTGTRQARYGTFTVYLVADPDVATQVQR